MADLNVVRNSLILATVCGALPAAVGYMTGLLGWGRVGETRQRRWTALAALFVGVPFFLSLMSAIVGCYNLDGGLVLFVIGAGVLALEGILFASHILSTALGIPRRWPSA